jgi:NAD(P)-dependent dehydrogenase (short-subunit alcohol dehydrogenase family)
MKSPLTAIVTGGNRGLGLETCRQLAELGYQVILTSRDAEKGAEAAARLKKSAEKVGFFSLDITSDASIQDLYKFVTREYGTVHVLVNNAAVYLDEDLPILQLPLETLRLTLETNTASALRMCQAFLPLMIQQDFGRVVNVSSSMGQIDEMNDYGAAYRLSKLALNGLTLVLADAVRGKNVLVNAVCPGWVRTDMGGPHATRSVEMGARSIVWAATLPDGGPNGGFFRDGHPLPW